MKERDRKKSEREKEREREREGEGLGGWKINQIECIVLPFKMNLLTNLILVPFPLVVSLFPSDVNVTKLFFLRY
jgi:hypothetical protein